MKINQHPFRKKWGQNFLTDNNLLNKIARTIDPQSKDNFLEIGPGEGALTERIYPFVNQMAAIEIDPLLINFLKDHPTLQNLLLIQGDILLQEIENIPIRTPVRIIGNIPYNITSPIIFWLIEQLNYWEDAFIMMQKEVAERLASKINTKAYGRLTVVTSAYLNFEYCFTIKPDVFIPKPKVESAIMRFTKKSEPLIQDEKYLKFNKLVATAFSQRRKMLRNTLKGWDISEDIKNKIGFDRRPESLTVEEFISMV
ncbi:MAG: 16S rRNA (adenine(1518)-N(6)/adenine(1519)-N(6))-dimethyltransferase RsmA [Candidatus Marinimicrobia bacterium]|jgi:16S rRNA (adenine1518-N6/adenine1519-N6)-dimethyltransferase|nr:16S rRNA (adenine(1518)-N(6)/adenine(1519)-N(6))-dimethyltransferase RsmA [Candidatus Neomarinimicrobiota bacterium]MDA8753177.1 16S rRNA (adenine(1518)-N(6)/adenine(1519)-N(6))-dimethyltransferase RsmA [Candidatus Neomarinimicrobiota bacterium]MDA9656806.1 16S rRNA (adenine(1518)-N(6)/adenine(1519)-N(6))-dimethyltransferase RsmA [Candidatus Neomarinimicrobiota bacterium]